MRDSPQRRHKHLEHNRVIHILLILVRDAPLLRLVPIFHQRSPRRCALFASCHRLMDAIAG